MAVNLTAQQLAEQLGAELIGDGSVVLKRVATLQLAEGDCVSFVSNQKYVSQLAECKAGAVIVGQEIRQAKMPLLVMRDPYLGFQKAVVALHGYRKHPFDGIHPRANVDPSAQVGQRCVIYPGAYVGPGVQIGDDCIIYANATIYDQCVLGDRVIVHSGVVIGVDGYGYATSRGVHHKIPQVGNVVLEEDVEIGANCVIARGALESTRIGKGTKLDGLVMIGHGAEIGPYSLLVAQTAIGGSTVTGHHMVMGGQAGIAGHLTIGNLVTVAGGAGVTKDIADKQTVMMTPAMPVRDARRVIAAMKQLPRLVSQARELERFLAKARGEEPADATDQAPADAEE